MNCKLAHWTTVSLLLGILALPTLICPHHAHAADTPYVAATVADPEIPLDELQLLLTPLTAGELRVEAEAWLALLRAAAHEISDAEIAAKRESVALTSVRPPEQGESAPAKPELLEAVNAMRTQRTILIDRVNLVLDALDRKGGDTEADRKYVAAVSGIRLDVSDTSAAWATVTGWLQSEEGGMRWVRNLGAFLVIVAIFWLASIVAGRGVFRVLGVSRNVSTLMRDFATKSARRVLLGIGVVVGLSALEVDIGPLLALIGAAGFVIAFALQDTLGNFASGIMILVYRPFDVGDVVDVAGVSGTVTSLNLVSVTLHTFDNKTVVIPNNSVWNNTITNATGSDQRRVDMVFGIGYGDDIEKAQTILESIVTHHALVLDDPEPVVRVHELGDSSVNFVCRPWTKTEDYWTVYWDVTRTVKEQFDANGVSIPFPQTDVHLHHAADTSSTTGSAAGLRYEDGNARDGEDFPESPEDEG